MAKKKKKNNIRPKLCVNIDHVATVRQARGGRLPDPVEAARIVEKAGACGITVHLREDRRHINDSDVVRLRRAVKTKLNLEMSVAPDVVRRALRLVPDEATIVPEKRQELTTEGGLDVVANKKKIKDVIKKLHKKNITVSLFIEPVKSQITAAMEAGADYIEIHTGTYAEAGTPRRAAAELKKIKKAVVFAAKSGLRVNAGHGLDYKNTAKIARIKGIDDLNTGHSIISRAVMVGLHRAVKEMMALMK